MTTRRAPLMEIQNDVSSTPVANGRRKSGRAVKAPEKFIPDLPSSQLRNTSAKRKRGEANVEQDASDVEEEGEPEVEETDEEPEEEESAGEEEIKESRRKAKGRTKKSAAAKKPAAKKPKVNGTAPQPKTPVVKLPNRAKKAQKAKKVVIQDDAAEGLYAEVFASGSPLEEVAQQWLERYTTNRPDALADIVNLILKCTGCNAKITEDDINDADNVNGRVTDLQDEYAEQNITEYPLISRAKGTLAFRRTLLDFFQMLIKMMDTKETLYQEEALVENLIHWIATMSSSSVRPFRHTSTVIGLALASVISEVAKAQIDVAAKVLRQVEGEKKNKRLNKSRLEDFQSRVQTAEDRKLWLQAKLEDIFHTIFIHRYRDVDPKIRIDCMEALGHWILVLPSYWLDGSYLRYLGWMLTDDTATMRLEVVKQIEKLMKVPENIGEMRSFIDRFRPRMVEIATRDFDPAVRSTAVDLIDLIRQAGFLEPDDIDIIGKLIFDSESKVRKSVVGFFVENVQDLFEAKVDGLGGEDVLEETLNIDDEEFDTPRAGWIKLKCLAEILLSYDTSDQDEMPSQVVRGETGSYLNTSGSESRFSLAAQVLYAKLPELKDWEMLAGYLLYDHTAKPTGSRSEKAVKVSFKPEEGEEVILLDILVTVVRLSLTQGDDTEKGRDKGKKRATRVESAELKETTTRHLADLVPKLLKKYGTAPNTATIVLRLEHVLNLEVFQELRQDSTAYAKLLDQISTQFTGHVDKTVLSEASAALLHARSYEDLEEITETKMQSLWENTTSALQKINEAGQISVRGGFRLSILTELSNNLARLDKLASISNCVGPLETGDDPLPINILLDVVARGQLEESNPDIDTLEDEVVLSAIRSSMFYFMWKTRALTESIASHQEISDIDVDQLKDLQSIFTTNLIVALSSRATLDPVRLVATGTLLDLHVLFATLRPTEDEKGKAPAIENDRYEYLQTLVHEIIPEVQTELTSIFCHAEKHYAKKSRKRLGEPAEDEPPEDDEEPEDSDDEEHVTENERQSETLKAEQQLCELTGKLILAILAKVIDVSGPLKGKLRTRIQRNRYRLGHNFKEVVAYLDEPKPEAKKSHKSKAQQAAIAAKKAAKSREFVEEEDEEEDPFADDVEPEEGTAEDLRRRELLDEDPPVSVDEDEAEDGEGEAEDEDDDMLGD